MSASPPQPSVDSLLEQRGSEYGAAWLVTGEIGVFLQEKGLLSEILKSPYSYSWYIILCKLVRLLKTPNHLDSWKDIEGYAKLVSTHIAGTESQ